MTIANAIDKRQTPNYYLGEIGNKYQTLFNGNYTTVASYSGSSGVLKRIWLALSANPAQCYINITFDGASSPQFGTNITTGFTLGNAIACDICFGPGFASTNDYWATDVSGCNNQSLTTLGGYIAIDMPFNSSFTIDVFNATGADAKYWCQVFYEFDASPTNYPYHLYAKPFNLGAPSCTTTQFTECPILSTSSLNGVILQGVKSLINGGGSSGWQEGKFRGYTGGPGMTSNQTYTAATPSNASYYNAQAGVTQIFQSTGSEDFFLSSYNFSGLPKFATNTSGIVLNSTSDPTGHLTCYRYFNPASIGTPRVASNPQNFVFTWTCGDQNTPVASSVAFHVGMVTYYA